MPVLAVLARRSLPGIAGLIVLVAMLAGCASAPNGVSPRLIIGALLEPCQPDLSFAHLGWSPDGKDLLFTAYTNTTSGIGRVPADGSGPMSILTDPASLSLGAAWSPDGKRIAYSALRSDPNGPVCTSWCAYEIYLMNADGSGQTRLTYGVDFYDAPAWSPDGGRVLFDTTARDGLEGIGIIQADGTGFQQLSSRMDWAAAWSPDGGRIVFRSSRDQRPGLYVMDADGSGTFRLGDGTATVAGPPAWSPDGAHVAAAAGTGRSYTGIYRFGLDGSAPLRVTDPVTAYEDANPSWSPDGTRIVFQSNRQAHLAQIFVVEIDHPDTFAAQTAVQLTHGPANNFAPAWSPDGTRIAYVSEQNRVQDVYVMNADGSSPHRLTNNPAGTQCLKWPF